MECNPLITLSVSSLMLVAIAAAETKPALAESWVPGHNSSCVVVCKAAKTQPVESGKFTNQNPYTVCRGNAGGEGKRPGYNLEPDWANRCFVAHGGKEVSVSTYDCLCR